MCVHNIGPIHPVDVELFDWISELPEDQHHRQPSCSQPRSGTAGEVSNRLHPLKEHNPL